MNRGMWTWLNVLALGVLAASCSASVKHDDGSVDLLVTGGASPTIARVVVSISGEGIPAPIARDVPRESKAWKQILGAIPTGAERTLHAVAIGADNQTIAVGHVDHVPIGGGRTTSVVLVLEPSSGVSGTAPRIDALVASMAASDETWTLRASAHDPDSAAQPSYSWSATLGAFDQPSASSTTWRASSAGLSVIRFVARDASGALAGLSLQLRAGQAPDGGGGGGSSSGGGASSSGGSGGGDSGAGGGGDGGTSSSGGAAGGIGEASVTATMNTWPIVDAVNATPTLIDVGATTALTTTASDPDGDPLTYAWSQGCVGSFDNATSPAPRFLLAAAPPAGICPLVVQVTDGRGGTNTGTFTIQTGAPPPVAFAPVIDSTFQSATTIAQNGVVTLRVRAHATDSSALVFDWSLVTGAYGARTTTANASETTWTAPAGFAGTTHLVATVRDSRGNVTPVDFAIAVATP